MRICIHKATKHILEMQSGGEVDRLPWMEWSLLIKKPEERTEEQYQKYLDDCTALEAMRLNTLKQNAINAGYKEDEIEVKWVTEAGYAAAKLVDPVEQASKIAREEQQAIDTLIQAKIKEQAIDALKKEGKLDSNGKLKK